MANIISTLKTMANKLINLNNNKIDIATMHALYGTRTTLTTGWSSVTNWTTAPSMNNAWLMGDKILISINITRNSEFSAGNITNELIGNFTCKTLGAISGAYSFSTTRTTYGQLVSVNIICDSVTGTGANQTLNYSIRLNASHAKGQQLSFVTFIPVRPNLAYYGLN